MEELNKYYAVWQEYNYVYEEWAKAHGLSVNSLLSLLYCSPQRNRLQSCKRPIRQRTVQTG